MLSAATSDNMHGGAAFFQQMRTMSWIRRRQSTPRLWRLVIADFRDFLDSAAPDQCAQRFRQPGLGQLWFRSSWAMRPIARQHDRFKGHRTAVE
ncbi:MAG: hypothetical protein COC14_05380 [Burkholderiaceae bacterium]|uniref:Uncharacterized protein n=1 Tax=Cupriavidus metallidurans (strain ATCC 43123 / DSM 2839 / NBRC 102507 / CH34) TaxID=266264 RepID=Q1LA29_CUPMC|nr:hypothetical protein Rmet_6138 [Cupriavidus metallidurans CH34]MBU64591.1 hypothetical protein [Cupriavidus sp.]PCH57164.1 MAG: hypothetical protein COC14_05380 [Burkholderiaceae bacterium]